mmetsp:Transcript_3420/g.6406  ORF Transcript_3420/g.6406 Transcript_3420/m.6406 type:complete len:534 (-) Transcript_3420:720-2321(-)
MAFGWGPYVPCRLVKQPQIIRLAQRRRWNEGSSAECGTHVRRGPLSAVLETWRSGDESASRTGPSNTTPAVAEPPQLDRVICKFGGSSLADADRLREVGKLVQLQKSLSRKAPVVVLSAMGPSTNELLAAGNSALREGIVDISSIRKRAYDACEELHLSRDQLVDPLLLHLDQLLLGIKFLKELSPRTQDYLVSFGERLSVRIFAAHLRENENVKAMHLDAFDIGFRTDSHFTNAEVKFDETFASVRKYFDSFVGEEAIAVVTGFIAKDEGGSITTLGRGGSDLTASVLGAALGVTEVQVWKDVDGILSTDPRIVKDAVPVAKVSFEEASEMAYFGAKVLHPSAMQPAMRANIPVRVKNSYNPGHPGTVILSDRAVEDSVERSPVTAISIKRKVQLVDIVSTRMMGAHGFLAEVFKVFARHRVSIDMIATSEVSISLTIDENSCPQDVQAVVTAELEEIASIGFACDKAIVTLVTNVPRSSWVLSQAMSSLYEAGIDVQMISQGASKFNISMIVDDEEGSPAVCTLHRAFFGA